jgi:glycerol kinase
MNVLAIDQGTSATKALVIAPGGSVLGQGSAPVNPQPGAGGAVTQDPRELLDSIVDAGRRALADAGQEVGAIGLGNQGETVLAWDPATGQTHGPAISWQDRRAAGVVSALAGHAGRLTELSGLPLDPYFAAPKMRWLAEQTGGEATITMIDGWVNHQLTGAFVTDVATASRTMLLDLDRAMWSPEACEIFGLDPERQPRIVANDAVIGETTAFGPALPVSGLVVDQQAALFAQSCFEPAQAKCTYGTGAFILANAGQRAPRSGAGLAACVAWKLGDGVSYCLDGQIYSAGAAIGWLGQLGLLSEPRQLDSVAPPGAPGDDAPIFVPALVGLGAPHWSPRARGGWLGLSLATRPADLVGAVLWGIAAQVAVLAGAIADDLGRPLTALRVDGGLSQSRRLMQAQADLLQIPVEQYPSPDATALGIGALARLGVGAADSPASAVGEWRPSAVYEPSISADAAAEVRGRFAKATRAVVELAD